MSYSQDDGGVEISVWDSAQNCVISHYEEDCACDMDPDEFEEARLHGRYVLPSEKLSQQFSHWCHRCECAFRHDDTVKLQFVCPVCGNSLSEFNWNEITADEREWGNFRDEYITYFEGAVGDGYDPDKYF